MFFPILSSILLGFFYAEVISYPIHRLLHSNTIPALSRDHMLHHLQLYGPQNPLRTPTYLTSVDNRFSFLGLGREWWYLILAANLIGFILCLILQIPLSYTTIFLTAATAWGVFGFFYIHDAFHITNQWLTKSSLFKRWFTTARKLHDIHHLEINDSGKMTKNFGICFYFMDRILNTYQKNFKPFNKQGFAKDKRRYSFIYPDSNKAN